jgi:hypothetical protein
VRRYLEEDVERDTGGRFLFTNNIEDAVQGILAHLARKRRELRLAPMRFEDGVATGAAGTDRGVTTYEPPRGLVALGCGHQQERSQSQAPAE